jgi:4-diphosphocytidyl-2-C-methyl-D-erythritol kinase
MKPHDGPVEVRAPAKVNLALSLGGPEPPGSDRPGWHRICTWMHAIDLADRVRVEATPGRVSTWSARWEADAPRPGLIDWPPSRDLAWRALRALEAEVGRALPVRMHLRKVILAGAGLGGGSADCAAALVGIDEAWGLHLGMERLRAIGAGLGSDVPFFLDLPVRLGPGRLDLAPRPALVEGFGERIERTEARRGGLAVAVPGFGCPTGAVYRAFDREVEAGLAGALASERVREAARAGRVEDGALFNDLTVAACAVRPALAGVLERASAAWGRPAHLTGSGSAVFCLCRAEEAGALAAAARGIGLSAFASALC